MKPELIESKRFLLEMSGPGAILSAQESASVVPAKVVKFEDFELDCSRYELLRAGRPIKLEKLPMELLMLLLEKEGYLVTREEITERLWGKNVFLDTEHGINTAVRKIRNVLRDDPEQPRFVQTVTGKGYRFIASIELISGERRNGNHGGIQGVLPAVTPNRTDAQALTPPPQSQEHVGGLLRKAALVLAGVIGVVAVFISLDVRGVRERIFAHTGERRIHSLAVLPLENVSGDPAQEYFVDGMTDELITMLARNSGLRVISRTSAMQFRKIHRPLPEIAHELGVDGVLEGSVGRSADRVHINVQLIFAPTDTHVWARTYDRDLSDVISLQRELAQSIAKQVGMNASTSSRPEARVSPEAHDAYLMGRYYWVSFRFDKSREYFEKAISLQPDYAAAWSGLSDSYVAEAVDGEGPPSKLMPQGEAAASRSLELDDSLAEAHHSMAAAYYFDRWDWSAAEAESKRAVELNPSFTDAHHLRAYILSTLNRTPEALEEERKAIQQDPFARPYALARALIKARQYNAALSEALLRSEAQPDNGALHEVLSEAYLCEGKKKEAVREWETSLELEGKKQSAVALHQAFARGGFEAALWLELRELRKKVAKGEYVSLIEFADDYALLRRKNDALHYIQLAYREHEPYLVHLQESPQFDFLHSDPRYQAIVKKMGLPPAL